MPTLIDTLVNNPQDILLGNEGMQQAALEQVKHSFDPIAQEYSIFDKLHVDGLDAEQVWTQAQMVVDGVVEKLLSEEIPSLAGKKRSAADMSESEDGSEEYSDMGQDQDQDLDMDQESDSKDESEVISVDNDGNGDRHISDESEEEEEEEEESGESDGESGDTNTANGLNDKFFNIDQFNQQILAMEHEDNDENLDFFGDVEDEASDDENLKYKDFFDPAAKPKKDSSAKKKVREEEDEFKGLDLDASYGKVENAMESARKDLFASDDEDEEDEGDMERGASGEQLSKFEKQQQELMQQIQSLEEENVAKKHWAERGEVKSKDRPHESLVFEDLDFERSSKPAPVITQEVTESLEDMIKRRIQNEDFDDIPRRLPDSIQNRKRQQAELQETKSQKSLAELYEEDYRKANDPTYKEAKQEEMDETHKEILDLYNSVAHKLDALCSWNYTPKVPKPSITIRSNTASIAMEDAQPTAAASSSSAQLAPQEVYQPEAGSKEEVIGRNNMPVARAEMSREERKRQRKRVKAKAAKQAEARNERQRAQAVAQSGGRADVMQTLKKGNVTVIGKQGEKRDVEGRLRKEKKAKTSSGFKL